MAAVKRTATVTRSARVGRLSWLLDDARWLGWAMLAPAIIYIALLIGFPFFLALYYSLSDITVGSQTMRFVGLKNFLAILETPSFKLALKNTLLFACVSQLLVLILAKILALTLVKDFPGKWVVRCLILLPWVAPISLGSMGWLWLATVILLAGLTAIPQDIHDAAAVDGAGFWRHLFQITVPLVAPIMTVAVLFGFVFAFTDMIVIYILTRGGPYNTTQVLASLAFFTGIDGGDLAEGAAISLFLFPLLVAVAFVFLRLARRTEVV
jgi:multiple sugar transport system permease protein